MYIYEFVLEIIYKNDYKQIKGRFEDGFDKMRRLWKRIFK